MLASQYAAVAKVISSLCRIFLKRARAGVSSLRNNLGRVVYCMAQT